MDIIQSGPPQTGRIAGFLQERNTAVVARRGSLVSALDQPALVAWEDSRVAGVLTYLISGRECEVLTLHTADRWRGTGTGLLAQLERIVVTRGCDRIWLITTNDNVDALRFYQRRGFRLVSVEPGAVDEARRRLKPQISRHGNYGIPLRDELLLERRL